jgi:hypothetical protein
MRQIVLMLLPLLVCPAWAHAAVPLANAGSNQTLAFGALPAAVSLAGAGTDPDGGSIVAYSWTLDDKPPTSSATLTGASTATPSFTADVAGTYRACLQVQDSGGEFSGTTWSSLPTAACTHVMVTTEHLTLTLPAKGQRNTWTFMNAWAIALDALQGLFEAFELALASSAGAALVGTTTKATLCASDTVEDALACVADMVDPPGPWLPLDGGADAAMQGTIYTDSLNTLFGTAGTSPGQLGTGLRFVGGTGAAASGQAGGGGGTLLLAGGAGGAGDGTYAGGAGGGVEIRGGAGGASGGAGAGASAAIAIGTTATSTITLGAASVPINSEGSFDFKSGTWAISGAAVTSSAGELNKLDGAGATVTAANLTSLTDGSNADTLHTHTVAIPFPLTATNHQVVTTTGRTLIGHWTLPDATWTTIRCYGACASTDGDDTDCVILFRNHADDATLGTVTIGDAQCGDTTGALSRFDGTFAASGLGASRSGQVHASRTSGSGTCEIAGVVCVGAQ